MSTVAAIKHALNLRESNHGKLGQLARGLRWNSELDDNDLAALNELGESVQGGRGKGVWEVERAVYEILSAHGGSEHIELLTGAFDVRGPHGDDRRRLALQGLSRVAGRTGDPIALEALESGLDHKRSDTRGWAIGFTANAYYSLGRALTRTVVDRLKALAEDDPSPDVRAEAATALQQAEQASAENAEPIKDG